MLPASVASVAIVGAGASGVLLALHLLRSAQTSHQSLKIFLIDRNDLGGVAYSTNEPCHRLNVPASNMSAFPDIPDDFVQWRALQQRKPLDPYEFVPRPDYRRYLSDRLLQEVTDIEVTSSGVTLSLTEGSLISVPVAVIALGNLPPVPPHSCAHLLQENRGWYLNDPWHLCALDVLAASLAKRPVRHTVVLVGTGLTMVDVALHLASRISDLEMIAVSHCGALPNSHSRAPLPPAMLELNASTTLPVLVDRVLAQDAAGVEWRPLADSLRPYMHQLWRDMSLDVRRDYMKTRHRLWSLHRNRIAPAASDAINALLISSSCPHLRLKRGTVIEAAPIASGGSDLQVTFTDGEKVTAAVVVNCTGPGLDPRLSRDAFVHRLLDQHICADTLGLGFQTQVNGALTGHDGQAHTRLFTLGPTRMGDLYESIAIPELRVQANDLAVLLFSLNFGVSV